MWPCSIAECSVIFRVTPKVMLRVKPSHHTSTTDTGSVGGGFGCEH